MLTRNHTILLYDNGFVASYTEDAIRPHLMAEVPVANELIGLRVSKRFGKYSKPFEGTITAYE